MSTSGLQKIYNCLQLSTKILNAQPEILTESPKAHCETVDSCRLLEIKILKVVYSLNSPWLKGQRSFVDYVDSFLL